MESRGVKIIRYADDIVVLARKNFRFLGFCLGKNGSGIYIRAHGKSLIKAKQKLKGLTRRNQGRNMRKVMESVKFYIRGWLRRRFRMYIWKQWKKPRTKVKNLQKLSIRPEQAYQWGNFRLGYWRIAGSPI